MRRLSYFFFVLVIMAGFVGLVMATGASAKDIKVGAVINLTGPASTWGQFHAKGHKDYFRYVNEVKGGVSGNMIKLTIVDHAYKPPEAVKYVKKFCTMDKVDMIATWDAASGSVPTECCGPPRVMRPGASIPRTPPVAPARSSA